MHTKASTTRKALDSVHDSAMDISQPLSLATVVLTQWAHEWSSHGDEDDSYELAQQHGLQLTKVDPATTSAKCPNCLLQKPMLTPQYSTITQGDQPTIWRLSWLHWNSSPLEEAENCIDYRVVTYSEFSFGIHRASAATAIWGLKNAWSTDTRSHTNLLRPKSPLLLTHTAPLA